jgi:hypothetical protein
MHESTTLRTTDREVQRADSRLLLRPRPPTFPGVATSVERPSTTPRETTGMQIRVPLVSTTITTTSHSEQPPGWQSSSSSDVARLKRRPETPRRRARDTRDAREDQEMGWESQSERQRTWVREHETASKPQYAPLHILIYSPGTLSNETTPRNVEATRRRHARCPRAAPPPSSPLTR